MGTAFSILILFSIWMLILLLEERKYNYILSQFNKDGLSLAELKSKLNINSEDSLYSLNYDLAVLVSRADLLYSNNKWYKANTDKRSLIFHLKYFYYFFVLPEISNDQLIIEEVKKWLKKQNDVRDITNISILDRKGITVKVSITLSYKKPKDVTVIFLDIKLPKYRWERIKIKVISEI